jgi:hypothetical protein
MIHRIPLTLSLVILWLAVSFLQAGEIHDAVQAGDLAKVKTLLAKDPKGCQ